MIKTFAMFASFFATTANAYQYGYTHNPLYLIAMGCWVATALVWWWLARREACK